MTTKKKEHKIPIEVVIAAIGCLTIIEIFAMYFGINGTLRTIIVAAICGLAGFALPSPIKK